MATELDKITSLQSLADSTGLIYDRAVSPEKVIGQAWLISRGRVVTLASAVSHYADAPWALIIKFPHPNLTFAVRTVTTHPDFDRREARDYYLAQARGPLPPANFENDIATLALDSDVTVPEPEKVAELNRALSLPFEISSQDMSGAMRGGECMQILQSTLSTGRNGLLTMVDSRNAPFARISIRQTRIVRAQFENLFNEIAMCELVWRKPSGNFAFQPADNFRWPADVPEIVTPTEQIMAEAMRRVDELPRVVEMLGGPDVRFHKSTKLADFNSIPPGDRWVAERLWEVLDGYLPLHKIPERAGTDTYSTIKMLWDFATMGLIHVNQTQPFHSSGQLGPLLVPAQELEISTWDQLTAMYVDPVSGGPASVTGNFFGSAHVLNNKSLLHTIPVPSIVQSAAIFKEGKLVGIHTGAANIRGANMPPIALQRMMWIGSLNDLGTKRLRTTEANAEVAEMIESETDPQAVSQRVSTLRNRPLNESTKTSSVQVLEEEETGPLAKFSKQQLALMSVVALGLGLMMMVGSFMMPHGGGGPPQQAEGPKPEQPKPVTPVEIPNPEVGDQKSKEMAEHWAQFVGPPPNSFKYADTMKKTEPRESFGLLSEARNTDIIFIHWPNIAPLNNVNVVSKSLPVYRKDRSENKDDYTGSTQHVNWAAAHYWEHERQKMETYIVGTFPSSDPARCVVFVAKGAQEGTAVPDMAYPARIVEEMLAKKAAEKIQLPSGGATPDVTDGPTTLATPQKLAEYRKKLAGIFKSNYKMPKVGEDADKRVGIAFTIDENSAVSGLVIKPNSDEDFNHAIQKAFDSSNPLPPPPSTKNGKYSVTVWADGTNVTVDEQ